MLEKYLDENSILLLGNGINRYAFTMNEIPDNISWENIIKNLANEFGYLIDEIPSMFPFTEVFDILVLKGVSSEKKLKESFVKALKNIKSTSVHKRIIDLCRQKNIDILTTNFDLSLEEAYNYKAKSDISLKNNFTHRYPWQRYYSQTNDDSHIKIWHIQGDAHYAFSLRLTVKDYIYSYNHFNKYDPLNNKSRYGNSNTWVEDFFTKKLVILGVGLEEQELFLRQLLYKRMNYLKNKKYGYYIYCKRDSRLFKDDIPTLSFARLKFFTQSVGLELVEIKDWKDIYE